jgi:arabinogalactan endo-1,4-beta-galactosidase
MSQESGNEAMSPEGRWRIDGAVFLAVALLFAGHAQAHVSDAGAAQPSQFLLGADISALESSRRGNWGPLPVYQENGKTNDEMSILMNHGWNAFRVRVFVSPVRKAPNNSLSNAIPLARHIKSAGATFLLCLHFSDTWADPGHQEIPAAWTNVDFDGVEHQWELHASNVVRQLKDAGAMPDWVQIGNEITVGAAWPLARLQIPGSTRDAPAEPYDDTKQWDHLTRLLKAGIRGVREASGDTFPRIAVHIDKGGNWKVTQWFFDHLNDAGVDYDIIAQSFYPPCRHGTLDQLWENMTRCAERYHKDFLVVETGYGRSQMPNNDDMVWPQTPEGRLQYMADLVNTVKKAPRGLGVMYWAPERDIWNADGNPGPAVFVLDHLNLTNRPASHAPPAVNP